MTSVDEVYWYYHPFPSQRWSELASTCCISVDASALVHSYRLSPSAADAWLDMLEELRERLFLSYWAAEEYQRNRLSVVAEHAGLISSLQSDVESLYDELEEAFATRRRDIDRSRVVEYLELTGRLERSIDGWRDFFSSFSERMVDLSEARAGTDLINSRISGAFVSSITPWPEEDSFESMQKEAQERIDKQAPPGFKDHAKEAPGRYGDYLIWSDMLEHSKSHGCDVVFVTEDVKEDWWRKQAGMWLGPRVELRREFREVTGQDVWFMTIEQLLGQAESFGARRVNEPVLQDVGATPARPTGDGVTVPSSPVARRRRIRLLADLAEHLGGAASEVGVAESTEEGGSAEAVQTLLRRVVADLDMELEAKGAEEDLEDS